MTVGLVARFVYGVVAAVFLAAGAGVLLLGTGLLPAGVARTILDFGGGDDRTMHQLQEFGTLMVFTGLVNLWCVRNYDRSLYFHWAMTAFWGLFALVHWFDYHGTFHPGKGQAVTTLPFVLFVILGALRAVKNTPPPKEPRG
jgi:hypothetical protein